MNTPPPWNPPLQLDSASDWGHVRDATGELIFIVRRCLDDQWHENECRRCGIDPTEERAKYILIALEERDFFKGQLNEHQDDFRLNDALAKLRESQAQTVALRDVCNVAYKTPRGEALSDHALVCLEQALSSPPPPCVPSEDVTPLLDALKIIAANPGASHGPSCIYDSGPISRGAIAKFTAQHPQTTTPTTV